ncbi:MAG: hypothetical protein IKX97_03080 [Erysipelotrichaceae bacterium]|nr:hypothetical protein [Erysipelotrichaceae bacterium]
MTSYLGIDGGGTKTLCFLADEEGKKLGSCLFEGLSHKQIGTDMVYKKVLEAAERLLKEAGRQNDELFTVAGVPCYGEDSAADKELDVLFGRWPYGKIRLVNDVEIAWAGALSMKEGIHLVAGTGSIAMGINSAKESRRCGGWSIYLDEGAGTWLAKKAVETFAKQADGRKDRSLIYSRFHEEFSDMDDFGIMTTIEQEYYPFRDRLASLQKILSFCAAEGDTQAMEIYEEAAHELSEMIRTLYRDLGFTEEIPVSYTGGIFRNGSVLIEPLKKELNDIPVRLKSPDHEPVLGAVMMAADLDSREAYEKVLKGLDDKELY